MRAKQPKVKNKLSDGQKPDPARLLAWYDRHRRDLPWRAKRGQKADPYRVWLSEVMLQQTTVVTVAPYFIKFIEKWPTLADLAAASLDDLLRGWAGLGYYRRARMLHACAQTVRRDYGGVFPSDETALLELPGFGPYTAAAVAAIAFDRPANVVDGNVERVIARIFAIQEEMPKAKPALRKAAASLVPAKRCGDYAQALMDLGATVCTPRSPKCALCPWNEVCSARQQGIAEDLPRREAKKAKPVRRTVAFVLLNPKGEVLLRRRPDKGLLAGMMEVPSTPWQARKGQVDYPVSGKWTLLSGKIIHVFTHFTLEAEVAVGHVPAIAAKPLQGQWVPASDLEAEALPSVMKKIVRYALSSL